MEVLLQHCTGPRRAHATKLYGVFFSLSLSLQPNPMMTTTTTTTAATTAAAAAAATTTTTAIFLILHSHIHCDLNHSCSKLTLHDLHLFLNPRRPHLPTPKFFFSFLLTVGNNTLFSNLPPSFKPTASFHTHRHLLLLLFKPTRHLFKTYRHLFFFKHYSFFKPTAFLLSNPPPSFKPTAIFSNIPRHLLISILFSNLPPPPFFFQTNRPIFLT